MKRQTRIPILIAVFLAMPVTACFSDSPDGPDETAADAIVTASNQLRFDQADITIRVGQTVEWRNTGSIFHTVTFDPARAADASHVQLPAGVEPFSSSLGAGQTYLHTFVTPGQYRYICEPHESAGMTGTITVNP